MSYIEKSLAMNETVIGSGYYHWTYRLVSILPLLFLLAVAAGGWIAYGKTISVPVLRAAEIVLLIWLLVGLWFFFARMIRVWTTEIAVTSQRVVYKRGWLSLDTQEMALPNIEGVKVKQGFWGRIFGYGRVRVEGTGVDAIETPPIGHPVEFRRAIENAKFGGETWGSGQQPAAHGTAH